MDPLKNPFSPGAGSPPPEMVGRDSILQDARILLARTMQKLPDRSMLLTGLRGVGKTVLLNQIEHIARSERYHTISIEAHEDKPLAALIAPYLRAILFELDQLEGTKDKVRQAIAVLRSFLSTVKVSIGDFSVGLDPEPAKGAADSGDLEFDLPNLLIAVGEAAADRKTAIAIVIDEVQYFSSKELGALIMAMHKVQQRQLPIVLFGAGLPILPGLVGESKSYAERLFNFPDVGALSESDAAKALQDPALAQGITFEAPALAEIFRLTKGYPYFIQEWGYQAWRYAAESPITVTVIREATATVIERLDRGFFRVRFDRLTPSEKLLLRAMADLGPGPQRTADVAEKRGVKLTSLGPARSQLLKKGMIYSPAHGDMAFTVPLFDEFMIRAMP